MIGQKVITRCAAFKPYCPSDGNTSPKRNENESTFEEDLCHWLVQQIPAIDSQPTASASSAADKVQSYLKDNLDGFWEVVGKVHLFIKAAKVTHYISAIDLGAAAYSISIVRSHCCKKTAKVEAGVEYLAGLGGGMSSKSERKQERSRDHFIGQLESVECGRGEGVIGYELLPVFKLICYEHEGIKKAIQKAIQFYLKRCSKFIIVN